MFSHRKNVVEQLTPLLKACETVEMEMGGVAASFIDIATKTQFVRYWQSHAECVFALEEKIRAHGGAVEIGTLHHAVASAAPVEQHSKMVAVIEIEEKLLKKYGDVDMERLPFDVQQLLGSQTKLFKDVVQYAKTVLQAEESEIKLIA